MTRQPRWKVRHSVLLTRRNWIAYQAENIDSPLQGSGRYFNTWREAMDYANQRSTP